jgi:hypothetical protein
MLGLRRKILSILGMGRHVKFFDGTPGRSQPALRVVQLDRERGYVPASGWVALD